MLFNHSDPPAIDHKVVSAILANVPAEEHDRLFKLLDEGPRIVESLSGRRPHKSALHRMEHDGSLGIRLQTVTIAGCRMSTARWLATYWVAVDAARRAMVDAKQKPRRRAARCKPASGTTDAEEQVLARAGVGRRVKDAPISDA